jgi:hypothetical protein
MSKPGENSVPRSELEAIARSEGCTLEAMASCIKVQKGKSPNRLYVTNPLACSRVDISNFDHPDMAIVRNLGGESFGHVHQMLRFDRPVEDIKASFRLLCRGLDTFESHPKRERGRPVALKGSRRRTEMGGPDVQVQTEETPTQHAERLIAHYNKIKEYARSIGAPISRRTVAEMTAKVEALGFKMEI